MYWSNLLHIYQPPTQSDDVIHKIVKECYGPLAEGLKNTPEARFILNINGSLTEHLVRLGYTWIIDEFAAAAKRGQIEFTGSAMYHSILPLLPKDEMLRQIKLNYDFNKQYFGDAYDPKGFFPPELCYSHQLGEILNDLGYRWVVMDEIGYNGRFGNVNYDKIYTLKTHEPFVIFLRKRQASDFISMHPIRSTNDLFKGLESIAQSGETYVFTAMDGETYGHHRKGLDKILFDAYRQAKDRSEIEPILLTDLIDQIYPQESIDPLACSWSTSVNEIKEGMPYGLWRNVKNEVHNLEWALTDLALEAIDASEKAAKSDSEKQQWEKARKTLDKALHSDQYWWASGRPGTGTIYVQWLPPFILAGAKLFRETIRLCPGLDAKYRKEAQRIYNLIEDTVRDWDETKKYKKIPQPGN